MLPSLKIWRKSVLKRLCLIFNLLSRIIKIRWAIRFWQMLFRKTVMSFWLEKSRGNLASAASMFMPISLCRYCWKPVVTGELSAKFRIPMDLPAVTRFSSNIRIKQSILSVPKFFLKKRVCLEYRNINLKMAISFLPIQRPVIPSVFWRIAAVLVGNKLS